MSLGFLALLPTLVFLAGLGGLKFTDYRSGWDR